jgi:hypothetical protein
MERKLVHILMAAIMLLFLGACMKDKPEDLPQRLVWNPDLAFPLGLDRFGMNAESGFDTTLYEIDSLTGLPRWVDEVELVMEGSVPFDISSLNTEIEYVDRILFRVNLYNGFPHEVFAQAYFMSLEGEAIDSLFESGPIPVEAGRIEGNGESIRPHKETRDAILEKDRILPLLDAVEILLRATIREPVVDTALIPYYENFAIKVDVGIMSRQTYVFE